eukprot:scaffold429032_cov18-Prasinocladus_malaysianus.AAC.1
MYEDARTSNKNLSWLYLQFVSWMNPVGWYWTSAQENIVRCCAAFMRSAVLLSSFVSPRGLLSVCPVSLGFFVAAVENAKGRQLSEPPLA